jgi:hypothetical protein
MGPAGFIEFKSQVLVMTQAGPGSRSAATPDHNNGVIYQGVGASASVMVVPARVPASD